MEERDGGPERSRGCVNEIVAQVDEKVKDENYDLCGKTWPLGMTVGKPRKKMSHLAIRETIEKWIPVQVSQLDLSFLSKIPKWIYIAVPTVYIWYRYATRKHGIFKKLGIDGPKPIPILGTSKALIDLGFYEHDVLMKKYGNVVGTFEGQFPVMIVYDHAILKEVLVKEFSNFTNRFSMAMNEYPIRKLLTIIRDDEWKRVRSTLSPSFSSGKLRKMNSHIIDSAKSLCANLMEKAEKNETFDFREYCGAFTMDAIASSAFGLKIDSHNDPNNMFVKMATKAFTFSLKSPKVILIVLFPFLADYLLKIGITIFPSDVTKFFVSVMEQSMEQRKNDPGKKDPDFLQLMMNAHLETEEDTGEDGHDAFWQQARTAKHKGLTQEEILAQGILFFLGGFETTANTLSLLGYCLATNPDVQEKLLKEIDDVLKDNDVIDYDVVQKMTYLDMCLSETLRIYPAGIRTNRVASEDITINGLFIPKDMIVVVPISALHMDPEIWPEPNKFQPERFTPEQKKSRPAYSYLPFGEGPRNCIGMRLALAELKVAAATILKDLKFVQAPETEVIISSVRSNYVVKSLQKLLSGNNPYYMSTNKEKIKLTRPVPIA